MSTPGHDPFRLQRLVSRRGFLGLSGLGIAAALGASVETATANQRTRPVGTGGLKTAGAHSGYHLPLGLDASSVLSEDHFLVKVKQIDPVKDGVVAYSRSDGAVEALLLENGTITQVYRDPAAAGGWNSRAIAFGATDMVAGVADNKQGYPTLHVFYRASSGAVRHLIEDRSDGISSAIFTPVDDTNWGLDVKGPLQITNDLYRNLLVFCISPASSQSAADSKLGFTWTAWGLPGGQTQAGILTGFGMYQAHGSLTTGSAVISYSASAFLGNPGLLVYVPAATGVQVYQYLPDPNTNRTEHLAINAKVAKFAVQPPSLSPPFAPETVTVESVDYLFSPYVNLLPTAIVRGTNQELYALTVDYLKETPHLQQLVLPTGAKREAGKWDWEPSNLNLGENNLLSTNTLLNLFLVSNGALSVVRQVDLNNTTKNSITPVYNPALPLQGGVQAVSSQTRASAADELIVVDDGGNLEVLTKRVDGGWTANQIHLPDSEPAEVSTYRVQLTLSDSWGARVPGRQLQVSAVTPAVALLNGQGVTLSSTPITLTTDQAGQVTIPIVADGLSAPALTISGGGLGSPATVSPSGAVNDYMTGTVTLNCLPLVTGQTLARAKTSGGANVFPQASQDGTLATQAATVLSAAAAAGADPTVRGEVASAAHATGLDGVGVHRHNAHMPHGTVAVGSPMTASAGTFEIDGIELSFSDLAHDALYAIKKGAAKVSSVAVTWDKTLGRWVSSVTADFDAWSHQILSVTIQGLDDAAHIFHGVVNKLGAVLADVIEWLRAHVLKLLADTVTLAARYDGWLLQMSEELARLVQNAKDGAGRWIPAREDEIRKALDKLKAQVGSRSVSSFAQPPTLMTSSDTAQQQPTSATASWLLEKVGQSGVTLPAIPSVDDRLETLMKQTEDGVASVGEDFIKAANKFRDALAGLASNPRSFGSAGIGDVIDALGEMIAAGFDTAKSLVDAVLNLALVAISAFQAILRTSVSDLPLLGPLLKAAGMTNGPTIGGLVTLLVSFPTVLGYKLAHFDADAVPFTNVRAGSVLRVTDAADDLSYATFGATSFWALMDTIAASMIFGGDEPPAYFAWVDIVAPAVIGALTVPAHDDGLPFSSTIKLDDDADVLAAVAWGTGAAPGVLAGVAYYFGAKYGPASGEAATESCLFLTSLCGLFAAGLGVGAALDASSNPADAVEPAVLAVLANVAPILAWGLSSEIVASTDGISALLAGAIGGACTFVASAMDGFGVA